MFAYFLIRETERWGPSTLLGAAFLLTMVALFAYYLLWRNR